MLVTLTEVVSANSNVAGSSMATRTFTLREITVNPQHVICLREDATMTSRLDEGRLPEGMDSRQRFTKLTLDRGHSGLDVTIVGDPVQVKEKLRISAREILRG